MSESKTPRTDECICSFAPGGWDVGRLVMVSRTIEAELSAALQRAEKAEKDLMRLSCTFAIERDARHQAEAELSRYREAEKALPEEPLCPKLESGKFSCDEYDALVDYIGTLRAHAAALQVERDAMREWGQMVAAALGVPGCNAAEMLNVIDAMREDAERYRTAKEKGWLGEFRPDGISDCYCQFDEITENEIDSARKEAP